MPDCAACSLFHLESDNEGCLHVNRPGGLELTKAALASCHLPIHASMLDAACGSGATLEYLLGQGYHAAGMDLSMAMLRKSASLPRIHADCNQIPLPSSSHDAVLMECSLSLSAESDRIMTEFNRLLRPGGWLVVTDLYIREINNPLALDYLSNTCCLSGARTEEHLRKCILNAGFTIRHWQDQTPVFKAWLARMVFKLGSLKAFYRQLASCDEGGEALNELLGNEIKLGYYWMTAQKAV